MKANLLIVGGAGYIGSVCAHTLRSAGYQTTTLDNLSTGHAEAAQGTLVVGDVRDRQLLRSLFREQQFDAVLHFAALSQVGESFQKPGHYYDVNVSGTVGLIQAMLEAGVSSLVFSSTCAVYGSPGSEPLTEGLPFAPVSPYGETKAIVERYIAHIRETTSLRATTLRYFNACGALPDGSLGEAHWPETHLVPLAVQAALGQRGGLQVFGTDYPTPDGTCIRDYIHVLDLADAHLRAMEHLLQGHRGRAYNIGTGRGFSVREVLSAVERVVGTPVPYTEAPRRPGDPPALVADPQRAAEELGWNAQHGNIDQMVEGVMRWTLAPRYGLGAQ